MMGSTENKCCMTDIFDKGSYTYGLNMRKCPIFQFFRLAPVTSVFHTFLWFLDIWLLSWYLININRNICILMSNCCGSFLMLVSLWGILAQVRYSEMKRKASQRLCNIWLAYWWRNEPNSTKGICDMMKRRFDEKSLLGHNFIGKIQIFKRVCCLFAAVSLCVHVPRYAPLKRVLNLCCQRSTIKCLFWDFWLGRCLCVRLFVYFWDGGISAQWSCFGRYYFGEFYPICLLLCHFNWIMFSDV
jgi:hypothetical protein